MKKILLFIGRLLGLAILIVAVLGLIMWAQVWADDPDTSLSLITPIPTVDLPPGSESLLARLNREPNATLTPIPSITPSSGDPVAASIPDSEVLEEAVATSEPEIELDLDDEAAQTPLALPTSVPVPTVNLESFETIFPISGELITPAQRIEMPFGVTNVLSVSYTHLTLPTIYSV